MYKHQIIKRRTQTDICTSIIIAALFTEGKKWKQSKCPLMVNDKMWYISHLNVTIK